MGRLAATIEIAGHRYDAKTIALLNGLLDDVWHSLSPNQQLQHPRSQIAGNLLRAAAYGERNPGVLRAKAIETLGQLPSESIRPQ